MKKTKEKVLGRPSRGKTAADQVVKFRATADERKAIEAAAREAGESVAEFVRRRALRGLKKDQWEFIEKQNCCGKAIKP